MGIELLMLSLDGVIFDTETAHLNACNATFKQCDLALRWNRQQYRSAASSKGASRALLALSGKDFASNDLDRMIDIKARLFHESIASKLPARCDTYRQLIDDAYENGCKLAVVTDMTAQAASVLLDAGFGALLHERFAVVLTAADFMTGGGSGAHHLVHRTVDIDPFRCAAIDSTEPGLQAARQAGIWALMAAPAPDIAPRFSQSGFQRPLHANVANRTDTLDALERRMAGELPSSMAPRRQRSLRMSA